MNQIATVDPKLAKAALVAGNGIAPIVPQNAEQAFRMADAISQSGLAPKELNTPQKVFIAICHGLEIGLPPMQAVQSIAVINGRPCLWGDAAIGLVQGSGLCEWIQETIEGDGDKRVAVCEAKRVGTDKLIRRTFSVAEAIVAGLWGKAIWKQYPGRMLQMRARAFCLRDGFSDVLRGLSVREEVRDYSGPTVDAGTVSTAASVTAQLRKPAQDVPEHDPETGEIIEPSTVETAVVIEPEAVWARKLADTERAYLEAQTIEALNTATKAAAPHLAAMPDDARDALTRTYDRRFTELRERQTARKPAGDLLGGETEIRG